MFKRLFNFPPLHIRYVLLRYTLPLAFRIDLSKTIHLVVFIHLDHTQEMANYTLQPNIITTAEGEHNKRNKITEYQDAFFFGRCLKLNFTTTKNIYYHVLKHIFHPFPIVGQEIVGPIFCHSPMKRRENQRT